MKMCLGCFTAIDDNAVNCPYCGFSKANYNPNKWALEAGSILNDKYIIGRTIGKGGFGITYLAWDMNMQVRVAIKEYYPGNLVTRDLTDSEHYSVSTVSDELSGEFEAGLERYVNEARVLSKFFQLPGIVSVKDFFYANNTAYIVMEYIDGMSLKTYLEQRGGTLPHKEMLNLVQPLIGSLAIIHENRLLHRDISPDNIMIDKNGDIKLIDFGAARAVTDETQQSMTVVLKHGYAPVEQYSRKSDQGPWTDVYALCAVMYKIVTGSIPEESIERIHKDDLVPVRSINRKVPVYLARAIEKGLSVNVAERYQNMGELYVDLFHNSNYKMFMDNQKTLWYKVVRNFLIAIIVILFLIVLGGGIYIANQDKIDTLIEDVHSVFSEDSGLEIVELDEDDDDDADEDEDSDKEKKQSEEESDKQNEQKEKEDKKKNEQSESDKSENVKDDEETTLETTRVSASNSYELTIVRDGILDGYSEDYTVGEILDMFSDRDGEWNLAQDSEGNHYVVYTGRKQGEEFTIEFQTYTNDTFKLVGATQDGKRVKKYSEFFQKILDSVGL